MTKRIGYVVGILSVVAVAAVFALRTRMPGLLSSPSVTAVPSDRTVVDVPRAEPTPTPTPTPSVPAPAQAVNTTDSRSVIEPVPFLSQAPTGKWGDPLYQNGCEEASALMVEQWASGKPFPDSIGEASMIRGTAKKIEKLYGTSHDTSAKDLAAFINAEGIPLSVDYRTDVTIGDIRAALSAGYAIIVPMDGRKLGNPHYTAPGPERHMVVAIGYDAVTKEIVTNDPGTTFGAGYRYPEARFSAAIRDYATGDGVPIPSVRKDMIVVGKQ